MKLLILLFVITSYSYCEEPLGEIKKIPFVGNSLYYQGRQVYFKTIKPLIEEESQNKYNTYQIIEIEEQRKKFERSGFGMQSMMDQTMPASYGVPPITTPRPAPQQQAAPAQPQQVQPAAQAAAQPQAQPEVKSYPDEASARSAGAKAGDIIILQNVKRSDGTIGPAKVRLKD